MPVYRLLWTFQQFGEIESQYPKSWAVEKIISIFVSIICTSWRDTQA